MSSEPYELFVWKSKKSFLEKMWHNCQIKYHSWHTSGMRVQALAHQKPAWLHSSRLQETLLPFLLRRESNMNGVSLKRAPRGSGCLWKEFGGEKLFWVDFREMVLLKDETRWRDGDDPVRAVRGGKEGKWWQGGMGVEIRGEHILFFLPYTIHITAFSCKV